MADTLLYGGMLPETTITPAKDDKGNDNSIWTSIFANAGGWAAGAASIIQATKGNYVAPGNNGGYNGGPAATKKPNYLLIGLVVGVVGLIIYMLTRKTAK